MPPLLTESLGTLVAHHGILRLVSQAVSQSLNMIRIILLLLDPDPTLDPTLNFSEFFSIFFSYNLPAGTLPTLPSVLFFAKIFCLNFILQALYPDSQQWSHGREKWGEKKGEKIRKMLPGLQLVRPPVPAQRPPHACIKNFNCDP